MAEFVSTFTTGFKKVVEKNLPEIVSGCKILNIYIKAYVLFHFENAQ